MLTAEMNERLTRVGPGTPAGELLRRYWQPIALASELSDEEPMRQVKILGEELVVVKLQNGEYTCLAEHCAHRNCSLRYGFLEPDGVRCAYHGWKYDFTGQCMEQPFEPHSRYKDRIKISGYPVKRLGGFLFAYMGPGEPPILPRWDVIARRDGVRSITVRGPLACNWLQIQENDVDTTHTYYLHAHTLIKGGQAFWNKSIYHAPIVGYNWENCDLGILKRITYGGDKPGIEKRPPLIFPNILRIGATQGWSADSDSRGMAESIHWRVPLDDHTTLIYQEFFDPVEGMDNDPDLDEPEAKYYSNAFKENGLYDMMGGGAGDQAFANQDRMAWETQGPVVDRTREHLSATDRGVIMYRKMLAEQVDLVEQGGQPRGLIWDEKDNDIIMIESAHFVPLEPAAG